MSEAHGPMSETALESLRYTKTHEWVRIDGGSATVGITDHAQQEISDVVFVELPKVGRVVRQGEEVAVVESVKAAFSIYAPVSGTVALVNETLAKDPSLTNRAPFGDGWIFRLQPVNAQEAQALFSRADYQAWVTGEGKGH